MEKVRYRAVIFLVKKVKVPIKIIGELTAVYGDSSPSHSIIKKRAADFKRGRQMPDDDPREGRRPPLAITDGSVCALETRIMADRSADSRHMAYCSADSRNRSA